MPNWCSNNYSFQGDIKDVQALKEVLDKAKAEISIKHESKDLWTIDVIDYLYTEEEKAKRFEGLNKRESFGDYSINDGILDAWTESAWDNCVPAWNLIIEDHFPSLELIYTSEESGLAYYVTNDPCVAERYILEICDEDDSLYEYCITEEEVITYCNEYYNELFLDIDAVRDYLGLQDGIDESLGVEGTFRRLYQYELVD